MAAASYEVGASASINFTGEFFYRGETSVTPLVVASRSGRYAEDLTDKKLSCKSQRDCSILPVIDATTHGIALVVSVECAQVQTYIYIYIHECIRFKFVVLVFRCFYGIAPP